VHILGITAFRGPSAACLLRDGRHVAAVREDRLSRRPHDASVPAEAIAYCLRTGKIGAASLDAIAVSGDERMLDSRAQAYRESDDRGSSSWRRGWRRLLGRKDTLRDWLARELDPGVTVQFVDPLRAHAQAALAESPFESAAFLVWEPGSAAIGRGSRTGIDSFEAAPAGRDPVRVILELAARARESLDAPALVVGGSGLSVFEVVAALQDMRPAAAWWVHPAVDGGADAIGAARFVAQERSEPKPNGDGFGVGPGYNRHQIRTFLRSRGIVPTEVPKDDAPLHAADALAAGARVAWFQGRVDFAEDTFGSRSILAAPHSDPHGVVVVTTERAADVVDAGDASSSPLAWGVVRSPWRERFGFDASPRAVFLVDKNRSRALHRLLEGFEAATGLPFLISETLRADQQPCACTPTDAYDAYVSRRVDLLLMENCSVDASVPAPKTAAP
jgi:predicted NodU family carbamoyl transferase